MSLAASVSPLSQQRALEAVEAGKRVPLGTSGDDYAPSGTPSKPGWVCERKGPLLFGCLPLSDNRPTLFAVLSVGTVFSAIAFSALQEYVFRIPNFRFGGWMTMWMYITYFCCATIERLANQDLGRRGSLQSYVIVAGMAMSGVYLTNWSVAYISYATRMVFKSSKVLPVMLVGAVMMGKRYSVAEVAAAALLAVGLSVFARGDTGDLSESPASSWLGVLLILGAVLADAFTANFEEKHFFRLAEPASSAEVMYYLSFFSLLGSTALTLATGEMSPAALHSLDNPHVVPTIVAFSLMGYLSVAFVLLLIKHFDATVSEVVKSARKVLQVVISFVAFARPLNVYYAVGGACVVGALWWLQLAEKRRHVVAQHPTRGHGR